jgi:hypothetical protein
MPEDHTPEWQPKWGVSTVHDEYGVPRFEVQIPLGAPYIQIEQLGAKTWLGAAEARKFAAVLNRYAEGLERAGEAG